MRPTHSQRALAVLNAVAREPTPTAVHVFDEFFYPLVVAYVRKRHRKIGLEVAGKSGSGGSAAPLLSRHQLDEAAHVTALTALRRARASAGRFDAERGSPVAWVLRSAAFAYVEVAKQMAQNESRLMTSAEADTDARVGRSASASTSDPAQVVASQDLIDQVFLVLADDERAVAVLRLRYDYTYTEIAEALFGDADATKRVDHLLHSARRKLADRWIELNDGVADDVGSSV
jgi:DNA-directed RNA polymerase specialized sigma24 family protein